MRLAASSNGMGHLYQTLSVQVHTLEERLIDIYAIIMLGVKHVQNVQATWGLVGCDLLIGSSSNPIFKFAQAATHGALTWEDHLVGVYHIPCWTPRTSVDEAGQLNCLEALIAYEKLRQNGYPEVQQVRISDSHVGHLDEWCLSRVVGRDQKYFQFPNGVTWSNLTGHRVRHRPCLLIRILIYSLF